MKAKEVPVQVSDRLDVVLSPEIVNMDEVLVTAMGISREKKSLTYSATEVKSDDLTRSNEANVVTSLSGKVAGGQISSSSGLAGSSSRITIRGVSSLKGNNQPLFIIDGVPFDNQEYNFDESDEDQALFYESTANTGVDIDLNLIASLTVLKGVAATVLYGSRASNGVILITTKSGMAATAPIVTLFSRVGFDQIRPNKLQEAYGLGTAGQYIDGDTGKSSWVWGPKLDTTDIKTYDRWALFDIGIDDADFVYFDKTSAENPWYQNMSKFNILYLDTNTYVILKKYNDPRLSVFAEPACSGSHPGQIVPQWNGMLSTIPGETSKLAIQRNQ